MTVFREILHIKTKGQKDMADLTGQVLNVVRKSKIKEGIVHVFNMGSTGSIGIIEFEPGLKKDFSELMERLAPQSASYSHEATLHDGIGHAHLQTSIAGPGVILPVSHGSLMTGNGQQIFHYEADNKPRQREIVVTVLGE